MFFVIRKIEGDAGFPESGIPPVPDVYEWTFHRKDKTAPNELGDAVCHSAETWPTERQARAHINVTKKSFGGTSMRMAKVLVL